MLVPVLSSNIILIILASLLHRITGVDYPIGFWKQKVDDHAMASTEQFIPESDQAVTTSEQVVVVI